MMALQVVDEAIGTEDMDDVKMISAMEADWLVESVEETDAEVD